MDKYIGYIGMLFLTLIDFGNGNFFIQYYISDTYVQWFKNYAFY